MKRLTAVLLVLLVLTGCYFQADLDEQYSAGYEEAQETFYQKGYNEGYEKGEDKGYEAGYKKGCSDKSDETSTRKKSVAQSSGNSSGSNNTDDTWYTYILNKNTDKFHYSWCYHVNKMNESNKIYSNETRQQIVDKGYSPCKTCNP